MPAFLVKFTSQILIMNSIISEQCKVQNKDKYDLGRFMQYFAKIKKRVSGLLIQEFTPSQKRDFMEALSLSHENDLFPEDIVDMAIELLGRRSRDLSSIHLRGEMMQKAILSEKWNIRTASMFVSDANQDYRGLWNHLLKTAKFFTDRGDSLGDLLLDRSMQFPAWFRILVTSAPDPLIIEKYRERAKLELNSRLRRFIRASGLDLDRICE